jgi:hypothetical protein
MAPGYEHIAKQEFETTGRMYVMEEAALRIKANLWLVENSQVFYLQEGDADLTIDQESDESVAKAAGDSNDTAAVEDAAEANALAGGETA